MPSQGRPLQTPVAFFIFNRPEPTEAVFREIARARPKTLLVIADGPRDPEEAEACRRARAVIEKIDWPCALVTNYAEVNQGCKRRLSGGLDWVFDQCEEAILLEDDCVPHPSFFPFCEQMLDRYRQDERVMMVAGTNYLLDRLPVEESYVFSRYFAIWGWATWRRAWRLYDIRMVDWERLKAQNQLDALYPQLYMRAFLAAAFDLAYQNGVDTWDIQWFYSCLFNSGLCVVPKVNLISNIGAVGHHSSEADHNHFKTVFPLETERLRHPALMTPNQLYDGPFFQQQFQPKPPAPLPLRAAAALKRRVEGLLRGPRGHQHGN